MSQQGANCNYARYLWNIAFGVWCLNDLCTCDIRVGRKAFNIKNFLQINIQLHCMRGVSVSKCTVRRTVRQLAARPRASPLRMLHCVSISPKSSSNTVQACLNNTLKAAYMSVHDFQQKTCIDDNQRQCPVRKNA